MLTQFQQLLVNTAIHQLEDCNDDPEESEKIFKKLHIKCEDTGYDEVTEQKLIEHIKAKDYKPCILKRRENNE